MEYRRFQYKGKWTDALITSEDSSFGGTPQSVHVGEIASILSVPIEDISCHEDGMDPLGGDLPDIILPVAQQATTQQQTLAEKFDAILGILASDASLSQNSRDAIANVGKILDKG